MQTLRVVLPDRPAWSPLVSPVSPSHDSAGDAGGALSARCRALAFRLGESAVHDDEHFDCAPSTPVQGSPRRVSPGASPSRSSPRLAPPSAPPPALSSPLSPRSTHSQLHPEPPTAHLLDGILEEDVETPKGEQPLTSTAGSDWAPPALDVPGNAANEAGNAQPGMPLLGGFSPGTLAGGGGLSLAADDEFSPRSHGFRSRLASSGSSSRAQRRSSVAHDFFADLQQEQGDSEMAEATVEEQEIELRQKLKDGATWLAVDIWLVEGELLVGPAQQELDPSRTFTSCIVEPLVRVFSTSVVKSGTSHRRRSSVFSQVKPLSPLQLVVRLRTPASMTFPFVLDALAPLHDAGLLTFYCPNAMTTTPGLITVVSSSASGAEMVPIDDLCAVHGPRFVYRDAPISAFDPSSSSPASLAEIDPQVTPVAAGALAEATGWNGQTPLQDALRERIRAQVQAAHAHGLKVRYEALPRFPEHTRQLCRQALAALEVDYL
ncbi:uncharacterized protein JCM10292_002462 [Rhodotorula paludigena]|uniref:uncharacterized protein n=1 Tax=Rhodotorula paludigena TaxID=86838 RepID=UPI0031731A6C